MSRKHKTLKEWESAGLITAEQLRAIEIYEENRRRGHFGRGLVGLSLLAILLGVLAIIASNWYAIPPDLKITVHVLLNLGVGAFALWADRRGKTLWREGACLGLFGLTLTLIALTGQIYQLEGQTSDALVLWMLVTLLFFLLMGNSYMTAVPWIIAFLVTTAFVLGEKLGSLPEMQQRLFVLGAGGLLPLALMGDGALAAFQRWKPALADVTFKSGAVLSALLASMAITLWAGGDWFYRYTLLPPLYTGIILAAGLIAIAAHAVLHRYYKDEPRLKHGAEFALVSFLAYMLPFSFMGVGSDALSAIAFIAYWVFIGWKGQSLGHMRLVSLSITLIAIRIFWAYVELFGSLMNTGFGLISGGVVMLVLIYAARKLNNRITKTTVPHAAL